MEILEPNTFPPNLGIRIQVSDDLSAWSDLTGGGVDYTRGASDNGDGTSTVTYTQAHPAGSASAWNFMRAVIEEM